MVQRVVRTADLSLEAAFPDDVRAKAGALAQAKGGFVVSSETNRMREGESGERVVANSVLRVPAPEFEGVLAGLRALGTRVGGEKVTGQDVTEEYVDLEARVQAERAVEEQYLAVLKEARAIPDVLAVQQKLGEIRTEIERAEGRRRYLENQTNLATITVHVVQRLDALERGPGFGSAVREAAQDAVSVAVGIVNGAIRIAGIVAPIAVLLGLPACVALRVWTRRRRGGARAIPVA